VKDLEQPASFGELLRRYRERAGLTQQELAETAGLSVQAISALERGERRRPYRHTVRALGDALDLSEAEQAGLRDILRQRGEPAAAPRPISRLSGWVEPSNAVIGREQDVIAVSNLLEEKGRRLVTLTGPGGVGKTRLAAQVAAAMAGRFAGGAVFVNLASIQDPHWVMYSIARALGLQEAAAQPVSDLVGYYLQEKQMLLVLDNFEHVLDAAVDVVTLLLACPGVTLLVTSRTPLWVRGEYLYPVVPLALPPLDSIVPAGMVSEAPSVQMFVQCAQAARPDFALNAADTTTVAAICHRLDGLPLALELAAARTRILSPSTLLARLDEMLLLLSGGARDLPERQQTMRQTMAWSYDLLTAEEQKLFRSLAVFSGGWTLPALEAIYQPWTGTAPLLDILTSLLDKSLIVRLPDSFGQPRFTMLETIRAYAMEQLKATGEVEAMARAHAAYYLSFAEATAPELEGTGQAEWLDRLMLEHDNLRAALDWFLEQGDSAAMIRLGWALWRYWHVRVHAGEGLRWFEAALALLAAPDRELQMRGEFVVGILLYQQGRFAATVALLDGNLDAADRVDAATRALYCVLYGFAMIALSRPEAATPALHTSLAAAREAGNAVHAGLALTGLAQAAMLAGALKQSAALLAEGEALLRRGGAYWDLGLNLNTAATMVFNEGQYARAARLFRECLSLIAGMRPSSAVYPLEGLAQSLAALGDAETAARLMGAAAMLRERAGTRAYAFEKAREAHDHYTSLLRDQVGRERLAQLWHEGRSTPLAELLQQVVLAP
jgi:predicted ATPase/DNA-binding XRE family transcriptional regulator